MPPPRLPAPPYSFGKRIVASPSSASCFIHFITSSRYSSRSMSPGTGAYCSSAMRVRTPSRISRYSPSRKRRSSSASIADGAVTVSDMDLLLPPCSLAHARPCEQVTVQTAELRRGRRSEQRMAVAEGDEQLLAERRHAERRAQRHAARRREPDGADRARVTQVRNALEAAEVREHGGVHHHVAGQRDQLL